MVELIAQLSMLVLLLSGRVQEVHAEKVPNVRVFNATVTAYTNSADEGFGDGQTLANGERVHNGAIACPIILPFKTEVEILGKRYICADLMAPRFRQTLRFDILMLDNKVGAIQFGKQQLDVTVFEQ